MRMAKDKLHNKVILAEFESSGAILQAACELRDAGYTHFDCHSPFPIHGMNDAMGIKRSSLSVLVGSFALLALGGAFYMQYWMSSVDYRLVISGKPFNSFQAYTPVVFALTVLTAAIVSFVAVLGLSKLPRFNHPTFSSERFARFSDDAFFVSVESDDAKFDEVKTRSFLVSIGAQNIEVLE